MRRPIWTARRPDYRFSWRDHLTPLIGMSRGLWTRRMLREQGKASTRAVISDESNSTVQRCLTHPRAQALARTVYQATIKDHEPSLCTPTCCLTSRLGTDRSPRLQMQGARGASFPCRLYPLYDPHLVPHLRCPALAPARPNRYYPLLPVRHHRVRRRPQGTCHRRKTGATWRVTTWLRIWGRRNEQGRKCYGRLYRARRGEHL